jgi:5,5'-dehydrodivanillate O-demethylase
MREANGSVVPCNWLQVMENLLDPVHVEYLHGRYFADVLARKGGPQLQDFLASHCPPPMKKIGFDRFAEGIIERHVIASEEDASWRIGTPSFFPTTSLVGSSGRHGSIIFVVPMDDTHSWFLLLMADRGQRPVHQHPIPFVDVPGTDAGGNFLTATAHGQDHMAVVTQGAIAAREAEQLGTSDAGIVLYRALLTEQLAQLENGRDPMNVRRNPAKNQIVDGPNVPPPMGGPDSSGWSRQRRRWAARHASAA